MANKYDILFSVSFGHDYFGGDEYGAFNVLPTQVTKNDLVRLGFIYKAIHGGFRILFDTQFQGSFRSRDEALKSAIELVFNINNIDPNFLTYTGGVAEENDIDFSKTIFCFTNQPVGTTTLRKTLQETASVGSNEMIRLVDYPEKFFSKPFGQIRIVLCEGLVTTFKISFAAKFTQWRYILASDFLKTLTNPAIINKVTGELFIGPETLLLPRNGEVLSFYSANPIMLTAKPNKSFQLVENYGADSGRLRVVVGVLPNPIPGAISSLPGLELAKIKYLEIFL